MSNKIGLFALIEPVFHSAHVIRATLTSWSTQSIIYSFYSFPRKYYNAPVTTPANESKESSILLIPKFLWYYFSMFKKERDILQGISKKLSPDRRILKVIAYGSMIRGDFRYEILQQHP